MLLVLSLLIQLKYYANSKNIIRANFSRYVKFM